MNKFTTNLKKDLYCENIQVATFNRNLMLNKKETIGHSFPLSSPAVVNCDILLDPLNGDVDLDLGSTTFGSTATYECDSGYTLSGAVQRTCEDSGSWQPAEPTCPRELQYRNGKNVDSSHCICVLHG